MKRLPRWPEQIETLNFHAAVDVPAPGEQRLVSDPERIKKTVESFEAGLRDSLQTPSRIRGWVSDQLFGLIAADLDGCQLVKQEDTGEVFYGPDVKLPDWRLTLNSGENILVEVKAENADLPSVSTLRLSEVARLKKYAALNGCPLYIAIHWVATSTWSLLPIDDYARVEDHLEVSFETAAMRNHTGSLLNDRVLGLRPTLEFRMSMREIPDDQGAPANEAELEYGSRRMSMVTTGVRMFAGGQEMVDERETALVWFLIQHARWPCTEELEHVRDDTWEMVFTMAPPDGGHPEQGFDIIGSLSELYTRMFVSSTTSLEDETTQLKIDIAPGTLPELVPTDFQSERLPLWRFNIQPTDAPGTGTGDDT